MRDYINYIDFRAIKLGDLANKIGDYKLAIDSYSKALNKLRNYQGDRMQPAMMASELTNKINSANRNIGNGNSILRFESWQLSKTSFVKGNQCLKYLYLDKHKKKERTPFSKENLELFKRGHDFEERVRNTEFPGGINVKEEVGNFAYFNSYTRYLIKTNQRNVIYEATIIEDDVLVMCDVLKIDNNGLIDIYEIKLNTELNEAIIYDLSIQYLICKKRFGDKLNTFNVIMRKDEIGENWIIQNLKSNLESRQNETDNKIQIFKKTLQSKEPVISMGEHCHTPYQCEFIDYCKNKFQQRTEVKTKPFH